MDVNTFAGSGYLFTHILVEGSHHGVAALVLQVLSVAERNGCSFGVADAKDINVHPSFVGFLGHLLSSALMVLAVGDDDDGFSRLAVLGKTVHG